MGIYGVRDMKSISRAAAVGLMLGAGLLAAGCSSDGSGFTTGTLGSEPVAEVAAAPKVDPACVSLASQIDGLRKDGISDKIAKAAAKKYKMSPADLVKADQLTRANADFQARCSTVPPSMQTATAAPVPKAKAQ